MLPFRIPPAQTRACDVVGLGLNSIDLVTVLDQYPVSDTKQRLKSFAKLPGGQIATALSVCARLGWATRYLGSFGDDDLGRLSRESLVTEGVEVSGARIIPGASNQFAIVLVDARSGARTVLWDRHPDLSIDPAAVSQQIVASGRLLLVDCEETAAATQAARYARDAGMMTIVDVERVRPGIDQLLQQIDAIIASETFPLEFTGHPEQGRAIEAIAREFNAPLVCVTLGPGGSLARCGGREIRTPGFKVNCVDSTGAGDAFRGGFAAGCLRMPEGDVEDVLTYANAVAALNCRALGARGGIPTAGEVEQLLYAKILNVPDQQPLEDLLARLERERRDADRAYNEALTALDRAIQSPPVLPKAPKPSDASQLVSGAVGATNEVVGTLKAMVWGIRALLWRILGSPTALEQQFHSAFAQHANWSATAQLEMRQTIMALLDVVGREFQALARFESLLVQYLQTITLYVDTKDRSFGGSELRDRLALAEQRLMLLKREIEAKSDERSSATAFQPHEVFAGNVDSTTYVGFEDRFRGARAEISRRVEDYLPLLTGSSDVVDVGCGRGELLDLLHAKGIRARGVDSNRAMVELCRSRGRDVEHADALGYLASQADATIGGLVAIQVVEHFTPGYLAQFLETAYHKMTPGAPLILETINPACWMAFFETYIRDLTHQRPLHPETLQFLVEASGFAGVAVQLRQPVSEGDRLDRVPPAVIAAASATPSPELEQIATTLNAHADKLNARMFSSMDYAVIARR